MIVSNQCKELVKKSAVKVKRAAADVENLQTCEAAKFTQKEVFMSSVNHRVQRFNIWRRDGRADSWSVFTSMFRLKCALTHVTQLLSLFLSWLSRGSSVSEVSPAVSALYKGIVHLFYIIGHLFTPCVAEFWPQELNWTHEMKTDKSSESRVFNFQVSSHQNKIIIE